MRTYGNTNIKKRLIRFCDTDKSRTDKVRRLNNSHTWKRSLMLHVHVCILALSFESEKLGRAIKLL